MKKYAVIQNDKVINILVDVDSNVIKANPEMYLEYTDGNWDYDNGIDGGDFFVKPTNIETPEA